MDLSNVIISNRVANYTLKAVRQDIKANQEALLIARQSLGRVKRVRKKVK